MRFTVATAVLAQALVSVSASRSKEDVSFLLSSLDMSTSSTGQANGKAAFQRVLASHQGRKKDNGFRPTLSQFNKKNRAAVGSECKPDVGVLSCGFGLYCENDESSSLGGVCASVPKGERKLEDMGNYTTGGFPNVGYYECVLYTNEYCDCAAWDNTTNSGDLYCDLEIGHCFRVCPNVCHDISGNYTSDGDSWEYHICIDYTSPYEQSYCHSVKSDYSCEITLDGVACTSCELESYCGSFDCENVGMGKGDLCYSYPYAPILAYCDDTPAYDPCYICGDGVLVYPYSVIGTPDTGYYSCGYVDYVAALGFFEESYCAYVSTAAQAVCCAAELYKCDICGGGGMSVVTQPNGTVSFPGEGTYTCAELIAGAEAGVITPDLCSFVPTFAAGPCGCAPMGGGTTDAPTMAMTNATDAPTMSPTMGANPTEAPTAGSGASSKVALTAVACATALVAVFSM